MTKNRRAKQVARERQRLTGEPYTLALRNSAEPVADAQVLRSLLEALNSHNWDTSEVHRSSLGGYEAFAGPVAFYADRDTEEGIDRTAHFPQVTAVFPY